MNLFHRHTHPATPKEDLITDVTEPTAKSAAELEAELAIAREREAAQAAEAAPKTDGDRIAALDARVTELERRANGGAHA